MFVHISFPKHFYPGESQSASTFVCVSPCSTPAWWRMGNITWPPGTLYRVTSVCIHSRSTIPKLWSCWPELLTRPKMGERKKTIPGSDSIAASSIWAAMKPRSHIIWITYYNKSVDFYLSVINRFCFCTVSAKFLPVCATSVYSIAVLLDRSCYSRGCENHLKVGIADYMLSSTWLQKKTSVSVLTDRSVQQCPLGCHLWIMLC